MSPKLIAKEQQKAAHKNFLHEGKKILKKAAIKQSLIELKILNQEKH